MKKDAYVYNTRIYNYSDLIAKLMERSDWSRHILELWTTRYVRAFKGTGPRDQGQAIETKTVEL